MALTTRPGLQSRLKVKPDTARKAGYLPPSTFLTAS